MGEIYERATPDEIQDAFSDVRRGKDTGEWRIDVVSHRIALGAVHNAIFFILPNGKAFIGLNGQAFDRETGESESFTFAPNKSLRVSASFYKAEEGEYVRATAFRGTGPEVLQKLGQGLDAATHINDMNLTYVPVDPITCSQNSNSATTAILQGMELDYPTEIEELWAPGECRRLLPEDWQSPYNFFEDYGSAHIEDAVRAMTGKAIAEDVINDPPADPQLYPYPTPGSNAPPFK